MRFRHELSPLNKDPFTVSLILYIVNKILQTGILLKGIFNPKLLNNTLVSCTSFFYLNCTHTAVTLCIFWQKHWFSLIFLRNSHVFIFYFFYTPYNMTTLFYNKTEIFDELLKSLDFFSSFISSYSLNTLFP